MARMSWFSRTKSLIPLREMIGSGESYAAKTLESRAAPIYNPPAKIPRPFEKDYPAGAPVDAASGRISSTIEGVPLTARHVAGRNYPGGPDQAVSPTAYPEITTATIGSAPQRVGAAELGKGTVGAYRVKRGPNGPIRDILVDRNLDLDTTDKVTAHEIGHLIDNFTGSSPIPKRVEKELRTVYNDLRNPDLAQYRDQFGRDPQGGRKYLGYGPEKRDYPSQDVPRELMAEGVRAYMADPNYMKTVAPNAAKAIREAVNTNPRLSSIIQFNALLPVALLGGGAGLASSDQPNENDEISNTIRAIQSQ